MELFGNFLLEEKTGVYKFVVCRVIVYKASPSGILRVVGDHLRDRGSKDVQAISFMGLRLERFPQGIEKFFPNLKILTINGCGLQSISKIDIFHLKHLSQLTLNGNFITSLPGDLFDGTSSVEIVSFYGNRIEFIGAEIFDSLRDLKYVNLKVNTNIDVCFKPTGISLEELKKVIKENCQSKRFNIIDHYFQQMELFGSPQWYKV